MNSGVTARKNETANQQQGQYASRARIKAAKLNACMPPRRLLRRGSRRSLHYQDETVALYRFTLDRPQLRTLPDNVQQRERQPWPEVLGPPRCNYNARTVRIARETRSCAARIYSAIWGKGTAYDNLMS
jgi:hypothetical protein